MTTDDAIEVHVTLRLYLKGRQTKRTLIIIIADITSCRAAAFAELARQVEQDLQRLTRKIGRSSTFVLRHRCVF